jgi:hypothetical protein
MEKFIPAYPDLSNNYSQLILHSLAEFHLLEASKEIEPRTKKGNYYKHQLIVSRLMLNLDRLFILHAPGTGKSCTFVSFVELFKEKTDIFRKKYIVTPPNLVESMKYQIICKCTNNEYTNVKKNKKTFSSKEDYRNTYELISFNKLFNDIKGKSKQYLKENFSFCIFNIDEITDIIVLDFSSQDYINNGTITWTEKIKNDILMLKNIVDLDDERIINSKIEYVQFWRLFHAIENSKVIIASGTPMKNRPSSFFMLMNLLLPLDRQMDVEVFSNNVFYYNLVKYQKYLNGILSYIETSNVVATPNYIGNKIDYKYNVEYPNDDISDNPEIKMKIYDSQLILYKVELFGNQANMMNLEGDKILTNQISSKFEQYICYVDYKLKTGTIANNDETTLKYLNSSGIEGLNYRMNSCAMYCEIVRIEVEAYNKAKKEGLPGPGLCFNYLSLVEAGIGSLKEIFINAGFEILENFDSLIGYETDQCNIGTFSFKLSKRKRAIFLNGKIDIKVRELILQLAGSKENIYGEYVQFLDGSEVMGIGINVKNALRFIRPIPEWNEASDKQSRERVFREDSHDDIRNELANRASFEGRKINPYDIDLNVDVYNICTFCRFFYVNIDNFKKLIISLSSSDSSTLETFYDETNMEEMKHKFYQENERIKIYNLEKENKEKEQCVLFNFHNIVHIVGFSNKVDIDKIKEINQKEIMSFSKNGEIPHLKLSEKFNIHIDTDIRNLNNIEKNIIICMSGIIYIINYEDIKKALSKKIILYHNNCEFTKNYKNGYYFNECNSVILNNDNVELIPINMKYISPSESRYVKLEEKSFGTRRIFRIAKQYAVDCITNHERTFNRKGEDYSLECDYDKCEYVCSSKILCGISSKDFIDKVGGIYWNNFEILYSKLLIKECKNRIIEMFNFNDRIKINIIYSLLIDEFRREYFIDEAIYQLVVEKFKLIDKFGFNVYVCSSNDSLFLMRSIPKMILNQNYNIGNYINKYIAILSKPDYTFYQNSDDTIINEIESINTALYSSDEVILKILNKMSEFKFFISTQKLLENCFGRIAYNFYKSKISSTSKYPVKSVDRIICQQILVMRCFKIENSEGVYFFHNQQEVESTNKQGEIAKLKNGSDHFKIFSIINDEPVWKLATDDEQAYFSEVAKKFILSKISGLLRKDIDGVIFISDYYLSYYNGTYRLTRLENNGENIDTIKPEGINYFIIYFKNSRFSMIPGNLDLLKEIEISSPRKKKELIIEFFRRNDLIFYYSILTK